MTRVHSSHVSLPERQFGCAASCKSVGRGTCGTLRRFGLWAFAACRTPAVSFYAYSARPLLPGVHCCPGARTSRRRCVRRWPAPRSATAACARPRTARPAASAPTRGRTGPYGRRAPDSENMGTDAPPQLCPLPQRSPPFCRETVCLIRGGAKTAG